ncbi:hypothetical protein BIFBIF_01492 [Bifidobacterium bifidum ATCC 29521 = JCM 1255 = DSM 20456]|nr:hypothetical protein BIFBIF_01492 [Bifidobacterium bifidum ATCC 29521 = JCM 1255 = DSM 20456]
MYDCTCCYSNNRVLCDKIMMSWDAVSLAVMGAAASGGIRR